MPLVPSSLRASEEEMGAFERVAGRVCLYLLAVRRWEEQEKSTSAAREQAYRALCQAEELVTELINERDHGPAALGLLNVFVNEWHHACKCIVI